MNYSTIKKAVVLSLVSAMTFTAVSAQDAPASSSAKVFGGRAQYRTWSLGLNAGIAAPVVVTGGTSDFTNWDVNFAYGATLRKQLGHAFGLELGFLRANVAGNNEDAPGGVQFGRKNFETKIGYQGTIMGVVNVATVDFLRRENSVNFLVKAGWGISNYAPAGIYSDNTAYDWFGKNGATRDRNYVREQIIPVGAGIKFKLSERVNFDLGYNMYFVDGDNFDGVYAKEPSKDKFSYGYGGIEFSLGSTAKPNLDWVNPVAMMYDELKDPTLRQEVEALKGRVTTLENTVNDLLKDSDGDGVADKLDKCPGTPAGTVVDGGGCPIKFPENTVVAPVSSTVWFDFDSSVLRTSSYATLDGVASSLKASGGMATLGGHASSEGTDEYNMNLSRDRANSVKTYLVNSGVDASKLTVNAHGESMPIASNSTEAGREQNRRVEIK